MSLIHYNTPMIEAAVAEIAHAASQTEANHQHSLQIVNSSAENFGGQGSEAFQEVIAQINHAYAQSQEAIQRASVALSQANDGMTQGDMTSRAQYI
ncbi:WXG100 family type VII secretion target [[Mycobacterium] nativiensis]|uniref:WXG100 family type VII secretion target n=1 Tax=[Mycobacterium] nativiensis TaxID=2855503 RepID=A0ABU5XYX5_9MYCO|nr:WXG100 family type VII secretion target [Mycolicibacter sp. MYC340]MEB3031895.1 WXG100 family type VII secretion target [Mycolicibacter sp. MYC340]